ncbi:TPA: hypothetical protein N0F65_011608 [Lagenidium giganteum]|uniref:Peptidase S74 domain-containing protein n=1 Tax=Lagenidium giganteum TaxID=4803 RepID=A0AAV2ZB02_9STRA|nr:TPA: hypothetical protein N0F65_011608 [Lagenidium giganteum]
MFLFTNTTERLRILANGGVNIYSSSSVNGQLTVKGSSSFLDSSYNVTLSTFSADGTSNIQFQQLNGGDGFIGTTSNHKLAFMTVYVTSDKRIKEDIKKLDDSYCDKIYEADIYSFKYKNLEQPEPTIGVLAQDLSKLGYSELLNFIPNEKFKYEEEGDVEGFQLSVDYGKIACLNFMMIKKLMKRIKSLEDSLAKFGLVK